MGLAASQARLLTITSRKADCEYQSMRLSHQKIALSRELNEISNEYQNSLNQTTLYYDFYGKGDTSNPLTYSLLMTPSALNDYFPTLILNQQGRVVVDSSIAAAARAAGIPQEGLNSMPSSDMRNAFIEGLFTNGVISKKTRDSILSTVYNQAAGVGSTEMISTQYVETDLNGLIDALGSLTVSLNPEIADCSYIGPASNAADGSKQSDFYLADLLNDQEQYLILTDAQKGARYPASAAKAIADSVSADGGFIDELYEAFSEVLNVDPVSANALAYARNMTKSMFDTSDVGDNSYGHHDGDSHGIENIGTIGQGLDGKWDSGNRGKGSDYKDKIKNEAENYVGIVYTHTYRGGIMGYNRNINHAALNLNNVAKAFLTYFAQYMERLAVEPNYSAVVAHKDESNLVTDDPTYIYKINAGSTVAEEDAKIGLFYDTLFNQLCVNGWTENAEVIDQEYLQEMLKNGMMFISTIDDDGYYYQENYSTNTFVKEVSDDSAIAEAEAKYTNTKARLNSKEEELDLKMKNLDTEISSLTTEYDSVKSVIDKNIEKSFKRYSA